MYIYLLIISVVSIILFFHFIVKGLKLRRIDENYKKAIKYHNSATGCMIIFILSSTMGLLSYFFGSIEFIIGG